MTSDQFTLIFIILVYLASLVAGYWRRKSFPLNQVLVLLAIVGVGFTAVVYFVVPQSEIVPLQKDVSQGQIFFIALYIVILAYVLTRKTPPFFPPSWRENFIKKRVYALIYKLLLYVAIPLAVLHYAWGVPLADLGLSFQTGGRQLWSAVIIILIFGGFNLVAGEEAAPIRAREFSGKQVGSGLILAFGWYLIEAGLVEEFFFRGVLQTRMVNFTSSPVVAIGVMSLLFGLAHAWGLYVKDVEKLGKTNALWNALLYSILILSVTGWFMGLLFWRTQNLLVPILVHGAVDAVTFAPEFINRLGLYKKV